ncbi:AMP-binding protein [Conexibacter sp. JD483]|uniref:class I adenylate-forming enzyme family protein n=1 Tax=unclassified Conexibacter TaxID=2627773 RepID=UPI00271BDDE0|nr:MULTISPECIES: AMP-binding protein [unclassified Conexibacter]MDO8184244.1 AMP-binding protein [Conexibacter sp. CPCC 205706]MDO8197236.1 AMP-binding protein [Conexibacter sp. CPCC 205762]MDR9367449.1 AMP-binding protein [Conexibacter sp. JD483]
MTRRALDDDLRDVAQRDPEREALVVGDRRLTYAQLDREVDRFAAALQQLGVARGERVAIVLPNGAEAAVAIYGVLRAGAAFTPLNPTIKADKLAYVLANCDAVAVVCDARLAALVRAARESAPTVAHAIVAGARDGALPDAGPATVAFEQLLEQGGAPAHGALEIDLAAIIYTSGSTGAPKGVTLTHRNMTFAAGSLVEYLELTPADRILCVLPLSFDYGLYQLLMSVHAGATLVLERGFTFPGKVVELLERERITGLPGVPTVWQVLTGLNGLAERELPHLRYLTNTAAALSATAIGAIRATFPRARLYSMYGLTECKRVSYLPPEQLDARPTSVGIAIPGTEVWVAGDDGEPVAAGEVGELLVRGAHVMQGYWNAPEATAARLRPGRWPWERVLATGDLFRADEEGYLYFVGRTDDIIKSRGEKVAPREVEEVLHAAEGVALAAVVGAQDPLLGSAVVAYVEPAPGASVDPARLRRHCAAHLEDYMVPQRIVVRDALPTTPNGKIDRLALSESATADASAASA